MSKNNKIESQKNVPLGRKRDPTRDTDIMEACVDILAEVGFDAMTMDMVAARAKAGKATLYRRWPSKAEMVRDVLINMSRNSVNLDPLPNTGSLKTDLLAILKDYSNDHSERKIKILSSLGSFFSDHKKLASETIHEIFAPITKVNRTLMERAIERGEISKNADIDTACEIIVASINYRTTTLGKIFDKNYYSTMIDNILLPAFKKK